MSLWYRAPEVLLKIPNYTSSVDIWSLGLIMAELVIRKALFAGQSEEDQIMKILAFLGVPDKKEWPEFSNHCSDSVIFSGKEVFKIEQEKREKEGKMQLL